MKNLFITAPFIPQKPLVIGTFHVSSQSEGRRDNSLITEVWMINDNTSPWANVTAALKNSVPSHDVCINQVQNPLTSNE